MTQRAARAWSSRAAAAELRTVSRGERSRHTLFRQCRSDARRGGPPTVSAAVATARRRQLASQPRHHHARVFSHRRPRPRCTAVSRQARSHGAAGGGYCCLAELHCDDPRSSSDRRREPTPGVAGCCGARDRVQRCCRAPLPSHCRIPCPTYRQCSALLAGRTPQWQRLHLQLPAFADNGQAVPMHLVMDGPIAASPMLQPIHLF